MLLPRLLFPLGAGLGQRPKMVRVSLSAASRPEAEIQTEASHRAPRNVVGNPNRAGEAGAWGRDRQCTPGASHVSAMSAPTVETAGAETAGMEAAGMEAAAMEAGVIEASTTEAAAMKVGAKAAMKAASVAEPEWKISPIIGIVVVAERRVAGGLVVLARLRVIRIVAIDRRIGR